MGLHIPLLETDRLLIRELTSDDLSRVFEILDVSLTNEKPSSEDEKEIFLERERWLAWTIAGYAQSRSLFQPPYGERAVILKETNELIGLVGYVPCLGPFQSLFDGCLQDHLGLWHPEVGLFYAFAPTMQRHGYATEAAKKWIGYGFEMLHLKRIIATTEHQNVASQRVMQKLGMEIFRNLGQEPPWLQVVGLASAR